ncbi:MULTISPECIES: STM3941 family protein [Flavobacterium]|uniref:STM3941 family protein n=1 Tax=Flavobacterium TaxID=237 RepID=UPI002115B4CE|nr:MULTISPECIES: STM3941 family protein [Flavobacterium]UUF13223.1 hypothetical protein NLJ00_18345 [Flavobacterium panici]
MEDKESIEVFGSTGKLIKLLFFSILFLIVSLWILVYQPTVRNAVVNNFIIKNVASILGLFMGLFGIYFSTKKLFDKKPVVVIDAIGIIDNSSAVSLGRILWEDIDAIKEITVVNQKFIKIYLKNPEDYISKETNVIKRNMIKMNLKQSGSPVSISVNGLKISFNELKDILTQKFEEIQSVKN